MISSSLDLHSSSQASPGRDQQLLGEVRGMCSLALLAVMSPLCERNHGVQELLSHLQHHSSLSSWHGLLGLCHTLFPPSALSFPGMTWQHFTTHTAQPRLSSIHFSKKMLNFLSWKVKGKKHAILLEASLLEALFLCSKGSINLDIFISTKYVTLLSRNKSNHPARHIQCLCY